MSNTDYLKSLEEWKAKILNDLPDAYEKNPAYMAMLDKDIEEAKK